MAYNGNLVKTIGTPNERIIDYGSSFDSSNSGLFKGAYDWDFNLNTPADSFYLQTPYTPDFNLSSGDISLEAYFNANSFTTGPGGYGMAILTKDTYGSNFDWCIFINSNTQIQFLTYSTIYSMTVTVPTMNVGQWYHVKFERIAGVNRIYLDGVSYGGTTTFGISDSSQFYITVGCSSWNNPGLHFDGYLDKVKIINNGLTVLNLEFESIDAGNLTMTDVTGKIFEILPEPIDLPQYVLETKNSPNRILTNANSYNGSQAGLFSNAQGTFLRTAYTPSFDLSTGDISVEAYFNANSFPVGGGIIFCKDTYGSSFDFCLYVVNNTTLAMYTAATSQSIFVTVPTINTGQWYHIKFERVSGINYYYLDGVDYISPSGVNTLAITNSSQLWLSVGCAGGGTNPNTYFDGYIDDVKIIKNGITIANITFESYSDATKASTTDTVGNVWTIEPEATGFEYYIPVHVDIVRDNLLLNYETVNTLSYDRVGTSIFDLTRNQHTGTLTNGITFDTTNGSLIFDGVDDYIEVTNDGLITPQEVTIEAWVYPTNLTGTVNQNVYRLDNAGTPTQMIAFQGSGTILSFGLTTDTTGYAEMDFTINPVTYENTWMHIVATYTDGLKRLFINGQKVSEATILNVGSPYGTLWNRDGWANLTNYNTTRVYTDWAATSGYNPPSMVGEEWVMFDYINTKYYRIKFTAWTPGNAGGGFAYDREEILTPSTFGPLVSFTKPDFATGTVDVIDTGLTIKRKNNQGIFNSASETGYVNSGFYYGTGSSGPATFDGTNDLYIGTWIDNLSESFTGKIGAVRLYQTALIPEEVLQNYNANKNNYL